MTQTGRQYIQREKIAEVGKILKECPCDGVSVRAYTSYFIYFNRIAEKQINTYRACVPDIS